ncbi:hypothetical protein KM043_012711 [Ampulex compressa]|nr:hypothetical protein KM043_012711 [Ampulex compressa]
MRSGAGLPPELITRSSLKAQLGCWKEGSRETEEAARLECKAERNLKREKAEEDGGGAGHAAPAFSRRASGTKRRARKTNWEGSHNARSCGPGSEKERIQKVKREEEGREEDRERERV